MGLCVRANRYVLALFSGSTLGADVFALRECDNPVCVKVSGPGALCEYVVAGTQFDNMRRMARARRGGGRPTMRGLGCEARRARSVALREARPGRRVGCRCGRECPDRYNYAEQRDYLFALWDALDLGDNVTLVLQWRAFPTAEASKAREWIVENQQ